VLVPLILAFLQLDANSFQLIVLDLIHVSHMDAMSTLDVLKPQFSVIDVPSQSMLLATKLTAKLTSVTQLVETVLLQTRTVMTTTSVLTMDVMLLMINAPTHLLIVMTEMLVLLILVTQLLDVLIPQLIFPLVTINPFAQPILATLKLDASTHQSLVLLPLSVKLLLVTLSWDVKKTIKTVDLF